ncbi:MAG TPA: tetratricopeptide repeat protein [Candidatus Acidoferrales bacterium]|nr:tetratricopeptide repeat protein [Candidatus Acidoferrales bacterium]
MRERLLLLGAGLAAFGASLGSGFHFDDYAIFSDPVLQSPMGWLNVWAPRQTRPLAYFTFWLNRQIGGGDPLGYHLFNLALHLGAVLLAWRCLRRLLGERAGFFAALIFAVHPIQSEAVNYIWARPILLAALLCFASLAAWLDARRWLAALWFAAALLAKEECAAFPLAIAWLEWRAGKRIARGPVAAMLALSTAAGARVIWATAVTPGAVAGIQAGISPARYLLAQGPVVLRYLRLIAVPYGFTVDADVRVGVWISAVAWAVLAGVVLVSRRTGWATWLIAGLLLLIPSSSVFPAADLSADRRMYLPMFAFAAAAGLLLARVPGRAVAGGIAGVLVLLSVGRCLVWMSEESLWAEAVERAPGKVRPQIQLARALPAAKGLELLGKAAAAHPYEPAIPAETGRILLGEGQASAALQEFGRALALSPTDARYVNNRGAALMALGQYVAARQDFERALRLDPALTEARENLEKSQAHTGQ